MCEVSDALSVIGNAFRFMQEFSKQIDRTLNLGPVTWKVDLQQLTVDQQRLSVVEQIHHSDNRVGSFHTELAGFGKLDSVVVRDGCLLFADRLKRCYVAPVIVTTPDRLCLECPWVIR